MAEKSEDWLSWWNLALSCANSSDLGSHAWISWYHHNKSNVNRKLVFQVIFAFIFVKQELVLLCKIYLESNHSLIACKEQGEFIFIHWISFLVIVDLDMDSWTTAISKLHASLDFNIFRGAERKIGISYMQIVDTQCNINNIPVYQFFVVYTSRHIDCKSGNDKAAFESEG